MLKIRDQDTLAITGSLYRTNWTGLTKLNILSLPLRQNQTAVATLRSSLVKLLLESPGLKELGLGVKQSDYATWYKVVARNGTSTAAMNELLGCFKSIVLKYHEKGGRPFQLKALELRIGMIILAPNGLDITLSFDERRAAPNRAASFYLWKLLTSTELQVLHMDTTGQTDLGFVEPPSPDAKVQGAFAWFCISKEYLPNLVRLVVTERTRRFDEMLFLEGNAEYLQRLQLDPGRDRDFRGSGVICGPDAEDENQSTYLHHFSYFQDAYALPSRPNLSEKDIKKLQPSHALIPGVLKGLDFHKITHCGWLKTVGVKLLPDALAWYGATHTSPSRHNRQLLETLGAMRGVTALWVMNRAGRSRDTRLPAGECQSLHAKMFDAEAVESGRSASGRVSMVNVLRHQGHTRAQWARVGELREATAQTMAAVVGCEPSKRVAKGLFYSLADLWFHVACRIAHGARQPWSGLEYLKVGSDAWRIHRFQADADWIPDEEEEDVEWPPLFRVRMEKLTLQEQAEQEPRLFSHAHDVAIADEEYRADPLYKDGWFEGNRDRIQYGWK